MVKQLSLIALVECTKEGRPTLLSKMLQCYIQKPCLKKQTKTKPKTKQNKTNKKPNKTQKVFLGSEGNAFNWGHLLSSPILQSASCRQEPQQPVGDAGCWPSLTTKTKSASKQSTTRRKAKMSVLQGCGWLQGRVCLLVCCMQCPSVAMGSVSQSQSSWH